MIVKLNLEEILKNLFTEGRINPEVSEESFEEVLLKLLANMVEGDIKVSEKAENEGNLHIQILQSDKDINLLPEEKKKIEQEIHKYISQFGIAGIINKLSLSFENLSELLGTENQKISTDKSSEPDENIDKQILSVKNLMNYELISTFDDDKNIDENEKSVKPADIELIGDRREINKTVNNSEISFQKETEEPEFLTLYESEENKILKDINLKVFGNKGEISQKEKYVLEMSEDKSISRFSESSYVRVQNIEKTPENINEQKNEINNPEIEKLQIKNSELKKEKDFINAENISESDLKDTYESSLKEINFSESYTRNIKNKSNNPEAIENRQLNLKNTLTQQENKENYNFQNISEYPERVSVSSEKENKILKTEINIKNKNVRIGANTESVERNPNFSERRDFPIEQAETGNFEKKEVYNNKPFINSNSDVEKENLPENRKTEIREFLKLTDINQKEQNKLLETFNRRENLIKEISVNYKDENVKENRNFPEEEIVQNTVFQKIEENPEENIYTERTSRKEIPFTGKGREVKSINIKLEDTQFRFRIYTETLSLNVDVKTKEAIQNYFSYLDVQRLIKSLQSMGINLEGFRINGTELGSKGFKHGRRDERDNIRKDETFVKEISDTSDSGSNFSLLL